MARKPLVKRSRTPVLVGVEDMEPPIYGGGSLVSTKIDPLSARDAPDVVPGGCVAVHDEPRPRFLENPALGPLIVGVAKRETLDVWVLGQPMPPHRVLQVVIQPLLGPPLCGFLCAVPEAPRTGRVRDHAR